MGNLDIPAEPLFRVTENDEQRVTEEGVDRIIEQTSSTNSACPSHGNFNATRAPLNPTASIKSQSTSAKVVEAPRMPETLWRVTEDDRQRITEDSIDRVIDDTAPTIRITEDDSERETEDAKIRVI